ncbi:MAG TPA: hypothetical protein VIX89_16675 [Bryobacteraceae bacterium]
MTFALFASMVFGQTSADRTVDRVFHFVHTEKLQDMQEIATTVRSIANIPNVSIDSEQRALTLGGTAVQITLAEWLFNNLDKPAGTRESRAWSTPEYPVSVSADDIAQVFYLAHTEMAPHLQEVATTVRSLVGTRSLFTYNAIGAVVVRGKSWEVALAGWLLNDLDQSTNPQRVQDSAIHVYRLAGGGEDVVRVFYLTHPGTVASFQKIAVQVRTTTQVRRLFTYNAPRAMALRGTDDQIAVAEQLIKELDR